MPPLGALAQRRQRPASQSRRHISTFVGCTIRQDRASNTVNNNSLCVSPGCRCIARASRRVGSRVSPLCLQCLLLRRLVRLNLDCSNWMWRGGGA